MRGPAKKQTHGVRIISRFFAVIIISCFPAETLNAQLDLLIIICFVDNNVYVKTPSVRRLFIYIFIYIRFGAAESRLQVAIRRDYVASLTTGRTRIFVIYQRYHVYGIKHIIIWYCFTRRVNSRWYFTRQNYQLLIIIPHYTRVRITCAIKNVQCTKTTRIYHLSLCDFTSVASHPDHPVYVLNVTCVTMSFFYKNRIEFARFEQYIIHRAFKFRKLYVIYKISISL